MKENPSITTLHGLLDHDASKFINGEIQLKKILSEWITKATSPKLKEVLQKYLYYVEQHTTDFNLFIEAENMNALSTSNRIIHAMIAELEEKKELCADNEVKDACLLAGVQEINHYKISIYGTAAAFAKTIGNEKAAKLFHEAEANEKLIDDRLTQLARFEINRKAVAPILITQ